MTRDEVLKLMESSKSEQEWGDNCDKVKAAVRDGRISDPSGDYPAYWFMDVIICGLAARVSATWKK